MRAAVLANTFSPVHFDAGFPESSDVTSRQDVRSRIATDEEQVGTVARKNAAAIDQTECLRGIHRRRSKNRRRSETSLAEELELAMHADPVSRGSAGTRVGADKELHPRHVETLNCGELAGKIGPRLSLAARDGRGEGATEMLL